MSRFSAVSVARRSVPSTEHEKFGADSAREERLAANSSPDARARIKNFAMEALHHAEKLDHFPEIANGDTMIGAAADDPVASAEMLTDRYLEAGDNLRDEQALGQVQAMAGRAIARLAWLRADLLK